MKSRVLFGSLLALMCMSVFATGTHTAPPKDPPPTPAPSLEQLQQQAQQAQAAAEAAAKAYSDAQAAAKSTSKSSSDNAVTIQSAYAAQVPALIMGTVIPVDCGFGGQAGGANTHAAGFLGATWTTDRCYTLKVATSWAAMGQYEYACEMLMDVSRNATKRRKMQKVDCADVGRQLRLAHTAPGPVVTNEPRAEQPLQPVQAPASPPVPATPAPQYVTPEQMREYVDRAFRKTVGK